MAVAYRIIRGRLFRVVPRTDGRMCLVTPKGIVIGAHAPAAKMRQPARLPTIKPDLPNLPRGVAYAAAITGAVLLAVWAFL